MEPENTTPISNEVQSNEVSEAQSNGVSETQSNEANEAQSNEANEAQSNEATTTLKLGDIVTGTISRHVRNLAFIALENGQEAYITVSELRDEAGQVNVVLGQQIEGKVSNLRSGIELTREYLIIKQAYDALEKAFKILVIIFNQHFHF